MIYLPQGHVIQQVQASIHQNPPTTQVQQIQQVQASIHQNAPTTQVQQFQQSQLVYVPQGQVIHQLHQQGQVAHTPAPVQD